LPEPKVVCITRFWWQKKQEISLKINSIIAMISLYQALGGVDFTENL